MNQLGLSKSPADGDLEKSLLFEVSIPELFRQNAFRLLELPISANQREISRRAQMLRMAAEKGLSKAATSNVFPVTPPPDAQVFKESERKLSDVSRRLIDELFWFWPSQEIGSDEAFDALAARTYSKAVSIWNDLLKTSNAGIGLHNLAILYHLSALDLEARSSTASLTPKEQQLRKSYWSAALQYWRLTIEHEGAWNFLVKRIIAINDPSVKTGSSNRIRELLPTALLKINSGLAVNALLKGDPEEFRKQIGFIRASGFDTQQIAIAANFYVQRFRAEIKTHCAQATRDAEQAPWAAGKTTDHLLNQAAFLLWGIDNFLPKQNTARDELRDEFLAAALACQFKFGETTRKWPQTLNCLEKILALTTNLSRRQVIENEIQTVRGFLDKQAYWCGEGYYDLPDKTYVELEDARKNAQSGDVDAALARLFGLYRQSDLSASHGPLIEKPLAWCLNIQATARINELDSLFPSHSTSATIQGFENLNQLKGEIAYTLRKSAFELLTACHFEPNNQRITENLTKLQELFESFELKMPPVILALMYFNMADESILQHARKDKNTEVRRAATKLLKGSEPDYFPPFRPSTPLNQVLRSPRKSVFYLLTGLGILWFLILSLSQNPEPSRSQPNRPSSFGATFPSPSVTTTKQSQIGSLEREIDDLQKKLTGYDIELISMESQLDEFQNQLQEFAGIINNCNRARRIGDEVDESFCADILKTHNQIVAKHNSLLKKHRSDQSARNQIVKQINAKVDRYNSLLHN